MLHTTIESPIGDLLLTGDGEAVSGLYIQDGLGAADPEPGWQRDDEAFADVRAQLGEYFAGGRTEFDLPLAPQGTDFQRRVWDELRAIPYGETRSYAELARAVGKPGAARAVGAANGRNPITVIVPCHRVIGSGGDLAGFSGGVERKRALLELEAGGNGTVSPSRRGRGAAPPAARRGSLRAPRGPGGPAAGVPGA